MQCISCLPILGQKYFLACTRSILDDDDDDDGDDDDRDEDEELRKPKRIATRKNRLQPPPTGLERRQERAFCRGFSDELRILGVPLFFDLQAHLGAFLFFDLQAHLGAFFESSACINSAGVRSRLHLRLVLVLFLPCCCG